MLNNSDKQVWAKGLNPDQTAPIKIILLVLLDTAKGNQTDMVKFYVNYGADFKYIW